MAKIPYNEPPISLMDTDVKNLKANNIELFNYLREVHNIIQGLGPDSTGTQDGENVDFTYPVNRVNHTGEQVSSTISDFNESVDDRVSNLVQDGEALTWNYNDGAGTLTGEVTKAENPGDLTIVTTETADATYSSNEQDMLNNLKTDVTNLIAKANLLLDKLQAAKLMEV